MHWNAFLEREKRNPRLYVWICIYIYVVFPGNYKSPGKPAANNVHQQHSTCGNHVRNLLDCVVTLWVPWWAVHQKRSAVTEHLIIRQLFAQINYHGWETVNKWSCSAGVLDVVFGHFQPNRDFISLKGPFSQQQSWGKNCDWHSHDWLVWLAGYTSRSVQCSQSKCSAKLYRSTKAPRGQFKWACSRSCQDIMLAVNVSANHREVQEWHLYQTRYIKYYTLMSHLSHQEVEGWWLCH